MPICYLKSKLISACVQSYGAEISVEPPFVSLFSLGNNETRNPYPDGNKLLTQLSTLCIYMSFSVLQRYNYTTL